MPLFIDNKDTDPSSTVFSSTLSSNGFGFETSDELHQRLKATLPAPTSLHADMKSTLLEISKKRNARGTKSTDHTRRRNQFVKESDSIRITEQQICSADVLIQHLTRASKVELHVNKDCTIMEKYADIARENRMEVEKRYEIRSGKDLAIAMNQDATTYNGMRNAFRNDIDSQNKRYANFRTSNRAAEHALHKSLVTSLLGDIIDLTHDACELRRNFFYLREGGEEFLPLELWEDQRRTFQHPHEPSDLNVLEWKELCNQLSARTEITHVDPSVCTATSGMVAPEYVLGELIKHMRWVTSPISPVTSKLRKFPLSIALICRPYSGRDTQAKLLCKKFNLAMIAVDTLLEKAIESNSPLGEQASAFLSNGHQVTDDIYVNLIMDQINGLQISELPVSKDDDDNDAHVDGVHGFVLSDFPNTPEQARLLEKSLTGYDEHHTDPSINDYASSITPSLTYVRPVSDPAAPLRSTAGLDIVLNIGLGREEIYRRCLGQLVDSKDGTKYNMAFSPPPENSVLRHRLCRVKDKYITADLSLKLSSFDTNLDVIYEWYKRFGNVVSIAAHNFGIEKLAAHLNLHTLSILQNREKKALAKELELELQKEEKARKIEEYTMQLEEAQQVIEAFMATEESITTAIAEAESVKAKKEELLELKESLAACQEKISEKTTWKSSIVENETERQTDLYRKPPSLQPEVARVLTDWWATVEQFYCTSCTDAFSKKREIRSEIVTYFDTVTLEYSEFLQRPSANQSLLHSFLMTFNEMEMNLRFDQGTKSELYLRVNELHDLFWKASLETEEETQLDFQEMEDETVVLCGMERLSSTYLNVLQAEWDKFHACILLLSDTVTGLVQTTTSIPMENVLVGEFECYQNAISIGEEKIEETPEKGKKKVVKKEEVEVKELTEEERIYQLVHDAAKRACTHAQTIVSAMAFKKEQEGESEQVKEEKEDKDLYLLENAISSMEYELSKFITRVTAVETRGIHDCQELSTLSIRVHAAMRASAKTRKENEWTAIESILFVLRGAIESEVNLPHMLTLTAPSPSDRFPPLGCLPADTQARHLLQERILPKLTPKAFPIVDNMHFSYFSTKQLNEMRGSLEMVSILRHFPPHCISMSLFVQVMARKATTPASLPQAWSALPVSSYTTLSHYFVQRKSIWIRIPTVIKEFQARHKVDDLLLLLK